VTLKLVAATLTGTAPAGTPKPDPKDTVLAVQIVFENGQTATFEAEATQTAGQAGFLNQVVKLGVPLEAFILNNSPMDTYKYRTDVVTGDGRTRQGDWVTDNRDTLFIVVS
jgi:hypothetical protein